MEYLEITLSAEDEEGNSQNHEVKVRIDMNIDGLIQTQICFNEFRCNSRL